MPESTETGISQIPQVTSTRSDTDPVKGWGALWNTAGTFAKGLMELQKGDLSRALSSDESGNKNVLLSSAQNQHLLDSVLCRTCSYQAR